MQIQSTPMPEPTIIFAFRTMRNSCSFLRRKYHPRRNPWGWTKNIMLLDTRMSCHQLASSTITQPFPAKKDLTRLGAAKFLQVGCRGVHDSQQLTPSSVPQTLGQRWIVPHTEFPAAANPRVRRNISKLALGLDPVPAVCSLQPSQNQGTQEPEVKYPIQVVRQTNQLSKPASRVLTIDAATKVPPAG